MNKEPLIPIDAHSFEVFAIKDSEESPTGKQAFIGFKLPNNDFHFIGVPFTEPNSKEKQLNKQYLKEILALKITLLREKQKKGEITFDEMLNEAVELITEYDKK